MKRYLTLLILLFWGASAFADEVETGYFSSTYRIYSGLSQTNDKTVDFTIVDSGEFIRGEYLWGGSRIELKQQNLYSLYKGGASAAELVDFTLGQDILNWYYQHSNLEFHLGIRADQLSASGSYTPITPHSQTRFQWISVGIRVEENREYFKITTDYKLKRVLESALTYSESYFKSQTFEVGMYDKFQHEYRISYESLTPEYSNTTAISELNWLFGFYSHQPEEPSTESYWKGYSFELKSNYRAGKGKYELDWVNQAVFFVWDIQNIASYGFYVKSHPLAFEEPTTGSWNEATDGGTTTIMHGLTLEGVVQIAKTPLHLGWRYRYMEVPYISNRIQNDFNINLSAKF